MVLPNRLVPWVTVGRGTPFSGGIGKPHGRVLVSRMVEAPVVDVSYMLGTPAGTDAATVLPLLVLVGTTEVDTTKASPSDDNAPQLTKLP